MGIMVRERAQEAALMELVQKRQCGGGGEALEAELQLPCGWEKCLDLKSGLIYFKDWNSGTLTYRDPRQITVPVATQRIGLLSISLPAKVGAVTSNASDGGAGKKRVQQAGEPCRITRRWSSRMITTEGTCATETATTTSAGATTGSESVDHDVVDRSLDLSLELPGTSARTNSSQDESVCTMEKVRSALARSNWLPLSTVQPRKRASPCRLDAADGVTTTKLSDTLSTALSLDLSSSSRESNYSPRDSTTACSSSPTTSQCSSDCFTSSPSIMSYEGDDDEVQQQSRRCNNGDWYKSSLQAQVRLDDSTTDQAAEVMVTVGCKSCLMYVMLSKSHPTCPKCGNTDDVLLHLPAAPSLKKQRVAAGAGTSMIANSSPTWSWC